MQEDIIKEWFKQGQANGASHVILTIEKHYECVGIMPVYIFPEQDVDGQIRRCFKIGSLISVLDLKKDIDGQTEVALACLQPWTGVEN
jgi:hypothetical protein